MVRNNMLVKTVVTGSPQRRNAERPGGPSAGGRAALGACSMVRNNMLVKTAVTGSLQRRNAERPNGPSAGGRAALGFLPSCC